MTRHNIDEYDGNPRLHSAVVETARDGHDDWGFEYEIPATTGGWIYYGDCAAAATAAYWGDTWPHPNEAVSVQIQSTHPRNENTSDVLVEYVDDMDNKVVSNTELYRIEGEPYRTPLPTRRRLFWEAIEWALDWMKENPAE
jgi:hypothetical protein